ncbi:hypothetical protein LXL04_016794 [Taraxacum kok-saghyz]
MLFTIESDLISFLQAETVIVEHKGNIANFKPKLSVEMDIYHTNVQQISATRHLYEWWNITAVRVLHVWNDVEGRRRLISMIDCNREKLLAIVPDHLFPLFMNIRLIGNVFALNHFTVEPFNLDRLEFEHYTNCMYDWAIIIHHNTIFNLVAQNTIPYGFPLYPRVHSFTTLLEDHTNPKRLIGTFKDFIILGVRRKPFLAYHLILMNEMGNIIHLMLNHIWINLMVSVIFAKRDRSIIFVSWLKLVHEHLSTLHIYERQSLFLFINICILIRSLYINAKNILVSTKLTDFTVHPNMPEAQRIIEVFA